MKACFQGGPDLSAVACASACSVLGGQTASAVFLDLSLSLAVQPLFIYWVFCFVFLFLNRENKNITRKFPFNHIKVYQLSGLNIYFVIQPRPPELFSNLDAEAMTRKSLPTPLTIDPVYNPAASSPRSLPTLDTPLSIELSKNVHYL